ncbi:TetR/AcrR family transcriptional regulator [Phaeobacter inhibens]|uniref:TetR/AcrR family transcriptional regulator n=1 Tax=Phaeobacter inhibens TaxID=221822 RepID=UPI0021A57892|nr:TetR/AcrR family transcriptional regulator [Phaeobacter inhibens]UWR44432.1 TetR/AcrR family transcriptional regulator [Phaeobacter inhibens]UWR79590.1 TetR/AcrR family transcriptional regulator [Phaeobacter inhibens]
MEVTLGRQRSFDTEHAIEQAMLLFWERGYEAASMADLSAVMGVNPPSIYAAFGNKQALFEQCAAHYAQSIAAYAPRALDEETTTAKALRRYVAEAIEAFCAEERPRGCLLVSAATNCGKGSAGAQELLTGYRQASETMIADRIRRGITEGDMPACTEPDLLAKYVAVLIQGLAAQARDGATADDLGKVAELALDQLPVSP